MFSVEITVMPASSSASTSSQRFSCREPGTFVCASSSTSATSGRRARIASTSISSNVVPRYSTRPARHDLEVARPARRSSRGRASRRSRRRRRCRARRGGAPRRASRTSCRRRARHRGRCVASRGPWTKSDLFRLRRARGSARARSRRARRGSRASGRRCARSTRSSTSRERQAALPGDARGLDPRVGGGDVRVEARARRRHGVDGHGRPRGEPVLARGRRRSARATSLTRSGFDGPRFEAELDVPS